MQGVECKNIPPDSVVVAQSMDSRQSDTWNRTSHATQLSTRVTIVISQTLCDRGAGIKTPEAAADYYGGVVPLSASLTIVVKESRGKVSSKLGSSLEGADKK